MHKLLERQLRRLYGSLAAVPPDVAAFAAIVDATYREADEDRLLIERAMDLSSEELMQRNAQLRASEERYRAIVETAAEGIWVIDRESWTLFANPSTCRMLGYSQEELAELPLYALIDPEDVPVAYALLAELRAGKGVERDFRLARKDGTVIWALVRGTPLLNERGEYAGALGMLTDITERKRAEHELKAAYERLSEVDRFRTQFINNAAHELGTPLTPIKIQLHLLKGEIGDAMPSARRRLDTLDRNIERLGDLVKDILDAARVQASKLELARTTLDLADVVREATESFAGLADERGIRLDADVEPGLDVHGDARRLSQVVYNLLSNALKFTPRGGRVLVLARREGDEARVRVVDTGIGLRPADVEQLFRPFTQVHDPAEGSFGGTGLGLYISRGIAEAHGGRVACESAGLGKGATFELAMPVATKRAAEP